MAKQEFAPGLPDPRRFGDVTQLPKGQELLWVIQRHLAERAGPHYDIRFGVDKGKAPTLFSFATKKLPEQPGQKVLVFQQPLHTGQYADFEGEIVSGYGKGKVTTHDKGTVLVTKVEPDKINFAVIHKKFPETFTLIRKSNAPAGETTARQRKTQGGTWLMINTTPTEIIDHKKVHYSKVPQEDVEKMFDPEYLASEKIDGAAALYKLFSDKIEVLSYRPSTLGRPIVHTYRVGGTTGINVPKHLVGSVLRGEIYGARRATGESIPAQELGGLLNATTSKSLRKQKEQGVELRNAIFNILRYGKKDVPMGAPLEERLKYMREVLSFLPSGKFHLPTTADTPEEQRKLWQDIVAGRNPRTHEGMVFWPKKGGKPSKVKLYDEHDVYIREFFPGKKGLTGKGVGGFKYSVTPTGPMLGEVGTGFSAELRRQMMEEPEEFLGRIAKIRAQEQFPSGAYRAPSLLAVHEDYPAKAAMEKAALRTVGKIGLGLLGGGLIIPPAIHAMIAKSVRRGAPITPSMESAVRAQLKGRDIPHLLAAEHLTPALAATLPAGAAFMAPEEEMQREKIKSWAHLAPIKTERALKRGWVWSRDPLPTGLMTHELGHGTGLGASPAYRKIINELAPFGVLGKPVGIGAGLLGGAGLGGLAGAAMHVPHVFEESRANLRAYRALKELGVEDPKAYKTLRNIQIGHTLPAVGSAATGVGAALLRKALSKVASTEKSAQDAGAAEEAIASPTTWGGLAGEAAFFPALKTVWHGAKTLPKHFAPGAVAKTLGSYLGSPIALAAGTVGDVSGLFAGAATDPEYQAGEISYGDALKRQLAEKGEAAQLKTQKAFGGRLGTLKGLAASPFQGIMSPVGTATGFLQALRQAGKRLVGMNGKKASILGPYVAQATDGRGTQLVDMIKPAVEMPEFLREPQVAEPAFLRTDQPEKVGLRQRMMSWLLGVKPKELAGLSAALSGVGRVTSKLQSLTKAKPESEGL